MLSKYLFYNSFYISRIHFHCLYLRYLIHKLSVITQRLLFVKLLALVSPSPVLLAIVNVQKPSPRIQVPHRIGPFLTRIAVSIAFCIFCKYDLHSWNEYGGMTVTMLKPYSLLYSIVKSFALTTPRIGIISSQLRSVGVPLVLQM